MTITATPEMLAMLANWDRGIRELAGKPTPYTATMLLEAADLLDRTARVFALSPTIVMAAPDHTMAAALRDLARRARALAPIFAMPMTWPVTLNPDSKP